MATAAGKLPEKDSFNQNHRRPPFTNNAKVGVDNMIELAKYAIQTGFIASE